MSNSNDKYLNLNRSIYRLRIKTTLAYTQKMSFEEFLHKHFEFIPGISPCEIFRNAIFDSLLAVEYAIEKNDSDLLDCVDILIARLESEQSELAGLFAKLLIEVKNLSKKGFPVPGIIIMVEFKEIWKMFKEKIVEKAAIPNKPNMAVYSNN